MTMPAAPISSLSRIREFLLAGNALFTVRSKLTGDHRTYLVEKAEVTEHFPIPTWFVKQLCGPDHFEYIGFIRCRATDGEMDFRPKHGTRSGGDLPSGTVGFRWLLMILNHLVEPMVAANFERCAEFLHAGRCGKCGRPLTNPESIETGIGPVCAGRD